MQQPDFSDALPLYIHHPCRLKPPHPNHPPPLKKPLRIQIQGPLESIQKLIPNAEWITKNFVHPFPQPAAPELAKLTYQSLYRSSVRQDIDRDIIIRDEYMAWAIQDRIPLDHIDYYGITFDHLVPPDDQDPEVLCLSIIEVDNDQGDFAHEVLPFKINPEDYTRKKVLVVPRCCQKKVVSTDRGRVNELVKLRDLNHFDNPTYSFFKSGDAR